MSINDKILANPILRQVQAKFKNQTTKGLAKYGETVNPDSYDTIGWLNHLQQELIDGVVYIEVLIQKMEKAEKLQEENKRLRIPKEVGERIREIRIKLGLSMDEFAAKIDDKAKSGTVSNWETGKNLPNNSRLKKIAELGNVTVEYLLSGNPFDNLTP